MRRIFVFNGDADGLCALQQLCLGAGDEVTVLDVSFHANRDSVQRLLAAGARVRCFGHHHAGSLPGGERLEAHIDLSPSTCTSAIVDRHLGGAGINHLPMESVGAISERFLIHFGKD